MAVILTPKQENFCLAYIETGNASEAYRRAYDAEKMKPETINRSAKELLDNPKISTRLDELRVSIVERHKITVDDLIKELEEARALALVAETVQASAAISATMGKAKLLGLGVDRVEMTGKNGAAQELNVNVSMTDVNINKLRNKLNDIAIT